MPTGLMIYNDDGHLTIDSTWSNMGLKIKTTVMTETASSPLLHRVIYTFNAIAPIVFTRCDSYNTMSSSKKVGTNQWTIEVLVYMGVVGAPSVPLTLYIFDVTRNIPPSDNFGLSVFNDAGEMVFDSNANILKVTDFRFITPSEVSTEKTYLYKPGRLYAAFFSVPISVHAWIPDAHNPRRVHYQAMHKNETNGVRVHTKKIREWGSLYPSLAYEYEGHLMVIDVTDM